jgi:hypothetical protein
MKSFAEEQQRLLDEFSDRLKREAEAVIGKLYTDVTPYAEIDAHLNFTNALWDEVKEDFAKEITSEYNWLSRAGTLRAHLLKNHREALQTKIIEDLEARIKTLQFRIDDSYTRYR